MFEEIISVGEDHVGSGLDKPKQKSAVTRFAEVLGFALTPFQQAIGWIWKPRYRVRAVK